MPDVAEPLDRNSARLLKRLGRSLPVLSDPSTASAPKLVDAPDLLQLRTLARDIRQHTLDHLDGYLETFAEQVRRRGGRVDVADDATAARRLARQDAARVVQSALSDEIGLAEPAAEPLGSDGGVIVTASFVVAETGHVCVIGDDAVAAVAGASTVVCLAGIESVVPRLADLAIMLKLLARTGAGRPMPGYTLLLDPATTGRPLQIVLVDNGRSELLRGEFRPVLRCIGCGACTTVCPVYRAAEVKPAGLWAGPIGAITRALLQGDPGAAELPHASTLCGACSAACPVRIDLPAHLIALRARSPRLTLRLRLWGWVMLSPTRYRWATRLRRRRRIEAWPARPKQSFQEMWRGR